MAVDSRFKQMLCDDINSERGTIFEVSYHQNEAGNDPNQLGGGDTSVSVVQMLISRLGRWAGRLASHTGGPCRCP